MIIQEDSSLYVVILSYNCRNYIKSILPLKYRSRNSVVGIVTGYGLDDQGVGVRIPVGSRIFSSPRRPDRL
jgi:hypothetical protein